jgi:hypothetical protein
MFCLTGVSILRIKVSLMMHDDFSAHAFRLFSARSISSSRHQLMSWKTGMILRSIQ